MRKSLMLGLSTAALLFVTSVSSLAADAKTVTVTGDGKCAKCGLKEADKCQNVIQAQEDGKTVTYYVVQNKVAKDFHSNVCQGTKKVTAKGTVKEVNGKKELTATELKVAE